MTLLTPADRIAFTGDRNRPGKKDWSGAFRPEAKKFAERVIRTDLSHGVVERLTLIGTAIREQRALEVGFFCHGMPAKIELGYTISNVSLLAAALAAVGCSRVALHACLTGKDPTGGFAAKLRDAMVTAGLTDARVLGSTTAGHTSRNPHRRLFRGPVGTPGEWFVEPGRAPLWKRWRARMGADADTLRWQLLEREPEDIRAELERG